MPAGKQSSTTQDPTSPNFRFYSVQHPLTGRTYRGPKRGWAFPLHPLDDRPSFDAYLADDRISFKNDETTIPQLKYFLHEVETVIGTSVVRQYADGEPRLEAMFGVKGLIQNPKPPDLISRLVKQSTTADDTIMDFFAGSGTTGQAVLELNREDGGRRRFILIEMGDHFDSVLLPRILKATYSKDWKDGKPVDRKGVSALYKVVYLESYDDTLEGVELRRDPSLAPLFAGQPSLREDYLLRYMLDFESRGSLLDLPRFRKPWDYMLRVRRSGVVQETPVDLVETFNYLIGLRVRHYDTYGLQGVWFVEGSVGDQKVLVVWRDCDVVDNDRLNEIFRKAFAPLRSQEFDLVYVNGDNQLPIVRTGDDHWKVNLIEETFHARMFDTSDAE